jgi:hypothetical protein
MSEWNSMGHYGSIANDPRLNGNAAMDIRSTLKELCEAFNAHDLDRIMTFFSDDCALEMPRGKEPWGSRFEGKPEPDPVAADRSPA